MLIFLDVEGEPTQEFSAIHVDEETGEVLDVFHRHVVYPYMNDFDIFARKHVHGLNLCYLKLHGLRSEYDVIQQFYAWLESHPSDALYAHAPQKEIRLLSLPIFDVCLPPWKERANCVSHKTALSMKCKKVPHLHGILSLKDFKFSVDEPP